MNRKKVVVLAAGLMLVMGVTYEATASSDTPSVQRDEPPSALAREQSIEEAKDRDQFLVENELESALATVTYVAEVDLLTLAADSDLEGADVFDVEITSGVWEADGYWDLGQFQEFSGPDDGETVRLVVDQDWSLGVGDSVVVAVTTLTRPLPEIDGYIRVVLDQGNGLRPVTNGFAGRMNAFLAQGRNVRPNSKHDLDVLLEAVSDGHEWIEAKNRGRSNEAPGGVLAAIVGNGRPDLESLSELWLSTPAGSRQLPQTPDDIPGLSGVRGRPLYESDLTVAFDPLLAADITFVAIDFKGIGILGPWNVDRDTSLSTLIGMFPRSGRFDVLGWTVDEPVLDAASVLWSGNMPRWEPTEDRVVITVTEASEWSIEAMSIEAQQSLVEARVLAADPGPRSEPVDGGDLPDTVEE